MIKLFFALVFLSTSVFAVNYETQTSKFVISDRAENGNRVYYNCDSVESKVTSILEEMGAIVQSVRCTGGIDRFGQFHMPARVVAIYESLNSEIAGNVSSAISDVKIREHGNCHLNNSIFKNIKEKFEITALKQSRCISASSRTLIKMKLLKAN